MTELDRLPPDQRAVLSLVLDRGKSYGEVAELLGIPEDTVRDRAHAALDALADDAAPQGGSRTGSGRGARPGAESGLGARPGAESATAASGFAAAGVGPGPARAGTGASSTPPPRPREPRSPQTSAGSRRAGALLLGAIVVVIVVVVILVSSGGGKGSTPTTTAAGTTTTTTGTGTSSTSTTSSTKPKLDSTIRLSSPEPSVNAAGVAYVLSQGNRRAFYVTAQGLPPSSGFFYAVWLYNSPSAAEPLGRASSVSSNGRMEGGNPLPSNAGDYAKLIVTRETSTHPKEPGPTVLSGAFTLH
ncbi:MAG: sigma factor-like helix-turn-helix DNA-binding protein [Solirubrobacteraceae bacterium]